MVAEFSFCSTAKIIGNNNPPPSLYKEILVANQQELNTAIAAAKPGDVIVMKDGIWTDVVIDFSSQASAALPTTLRAQTSGNVILNGYQNKTL